MTSIDRPLLNWYDIYWPDLLWPAMTSFDLRWPLLTCHDLYWPDLTSNSVGTKHVSTNWGRYRNRGETAADRAWAKPPQIGGQRCKCSLCPKTPQVIFFYSVTYTSRIMIFFISLIKLKMNMLGDKNKNGERKLHKMSRNCIFSAYTLKKCCCTPYYFYGFFFCAFIQVPRQA